ncbi:MAG: SBBP repeat-containing protein [Ferruginibacter sp.]
MKNIYFTVFILLLQLTAFCQVPALQWAKTLGEPAGVDVFNKIIPLSNGDLISVGRFEGTVDFDPGPTVFNLTAGGAMDIVIAKYAGSGDFIWAKKIGGSVSGSSNSHIIDPADVIVDSSDNLYITGSYIGTIDMDPTAAEYFLLPPPGGAGLDRIFVAKYNSTGDLQWAFGYGANDVSNNPSYNKGLGICIDTTGDLLVTGKFHRTCDFDPGPGLFELTSIGTFEDIFFAKYTADGNFVWAKKVGGAGIQDTPTGLITDSSNNVYICGFIAIEADFDPGPGLAMVSSNNGGGDIFLAKYDVNGNYLWAFSAGSSVFYDIPSAIGFDEAGNILMTGYYTGTVDFDPGAGTFNLTSITSPGIVPDIFMVKYNTTGNLIWAKNLEGPGYKSSGNNILMDKFGRIFMAGSFYNTMDFDPSPAVATLDAGPTGNAGFIAQYDNDGNYLNAAAITGADTYLNPWGLFVDQFENIYFSGGFEREADFDMGVGIYNLTATGTRQDIFMAKYITGSALLSGNVWRDDNANGVQDNGELGVGSITMQIVYDRNNDGSIEPNEGIITTRTLNDGSYAFSEMPPGRYIVRPVLTGAITNTTPGALDADLTEGQVINEKDFGIQFLIVPVTCSSFSASIQNNNVVLKWTTETETNSSGFNIQRSNDGINFETIGWLAAKGNSSTPMDYLFTNAGSFPGKIYYYRLQEVSLNGTQKFICRVVLIRFEEKNKLVTLFPNPAQNYVDIELNDLPAGLVAIAIYDAKGMLVKNIQLQVTDGKAYERIPVADLPVGVYVIVIAANKVEIAKEKIIKN